MFQPTPQPTNNQWDLYAEQARQQLPPAPPGLLNGYVRWAPWVAIVLGVLGVIGGIVLMVSILGFVRGLESVIDGAIAAVGGYFMLKYSVTGWWLLALGIVISVLTDLVTVSIIGLVISLLIAYIHLQVKPRYS